MAKTIRIRENEWYVIVNPNAGLRKAGRDWPRISRLLDQAGLNFTAVHTTHKEHAISLTTTAVRKGYRNFIVVGGDGTLNEVVNGFFLQKFISVAELVVGMVPVGTGNDWRRTFGISDHYEAAVQTLLKGQTLLQDVGVVTYRNARGSKLRYFANVAGIGYDAVVAQKTNLQKDKGKGGPLSYLINLFTSLLYYKYSQLRVVVDGEVFTGPAFSMGIGICRYNGGGMMQLPNAAPDDGLLDATLIRKIGKLAVITQIKNLYDGSFIRHPKAKTFRGKEILVESNPPISLEADGESLGYSPFRFTVIPTALRVIYEQKKW
jgi:YegS/Rv2252/BmrU family lipid kinase